MGPAGRRSCGWPARQCGTSPCGELARQLSVSPSFLSQMENGKSQPSVATLYSIAQVLGVSIDELFHTDDASSGEATAATTVAEARAAAKGRVRRWES